MFYELHKGQIGHNVSQCKLNGYILLSDVLKCIKEYITN